MISTIRRLGNFIGRPGWPIVIVALLEIAIFAGSCQSWWNHCRSADRPTTLQGEGMIIGGDGLGYYAWLRSLLIDGDWSFANEFDEHNVFGHAVVGPERTTRLGLRGNHYPIGLPCVWTPAVVVTHGGMSVCPGVWPADGYTLPYQLAVGITTLAVSLIGLGFIYAICRRYADPGSAALAAGFLTLGTTIVFYSSIETSMAHGIGAAAIAGFVWYWLQSYGSLSPKRWLIVGALLGLATLIRSQLGTFAVLPAFEALMICWRSLRKGSGENVRPALCGLCLAGIAAFIAFSPQFVSWRFVYGRWLEMPHHLAHHWSRPSFWQVFGTMDRSLFYWTPITLIACIGTAIYCLKRPQGFVHDASVTLPADPREPIVMLAIAFVLQAYFVASAWGTGVYLGTSYGFRLLTEALVVLAPGLALLIGQAPAWRARSTVVVCSLLVIWNLLLIRQYVTSLIPQQEGAPLQTLVENLPKALGL